ncbi:MAG: DEAD/DEAH box helicase [Bacillota bacterium]
MTTFYELGLSQPVIQATIDMGFEETTPIQEKTIPAVMAGRDIIGQAQTGTGKTAAFAIPLAEKLNIDTGYIQGLVVTPTRELAVQVAEEINKISQLKGVRALPIYGGQDIVRQIRALRNRPQVIVGTPGRLLDHMRRRTIVLQHVSMVILDEADEMLNMGFIEDIENILREVPEDRQTLLFSATMPAPILSLSQRFMKDPEFISVKTKEMTVTNTEQIYIEVQERQKFDVLCRLLDIQSPDLAIIFARTKRRVDELFEALNKRGYSAEGIHGDLSQARRDSVMHRFKEGVVDIMVATDVAARGLDISGVTHVYNFDIPQDPEGYVHRIGRTGRAGKTGKAITMVTPREIGQLRLIEQITKRKIIRKPIPTVNEAIEGQQRLAVDKLMKAVEDGDTFQYKELAEELLEVNDSVSLVSAALKLLTREPDNTPVKITEEAPAWGNRPGAGWNDRPGYHRKPQNNRGSKSPRNMHRGY